MAASSSIRLVIFTIDGQRYGLHVQVVSHVFQAVEITPLPRGPDIVSGIINVRGQILPLLDVRRRLGLPPRRLELSDLYIVAQTGQRTVALHVEGINGVIECPVENEVEAGEIAPGLSQIEGVVKLEDGLIFIYDLARFLSLEEEAMLDVALESEVE